MLTCDVAEQALERARSGQEFAEVTAQFEALQLRFAATSRYADELALTINAICDAYGVGEPATAAAPVCIGEAP